MPHLTRGSPVPDARVQRAHPDRPPDASPLPPHGGVQDRSGRTWLAFSVESVFGGLPKKQTATFDPDTGKLLTYEEKLTEDAGELNVRIPSVTEYTTHLSSTYSNRLGIDRGLSIPATNTAWLTVYDRRRASVQPSPGGGTKK